MKIRAITFDLDDTLWPIMPTIAAAERSLWRWLEENAPRVVSEVGLRGLTELRETVLDERPEMEHDFSAQRLESLKRAMTAARYDVTAAEVAFEVFYKARNVVEFYDDVVPTLDLLKGNYQLAAISNGNADLGLTGLTRWLTVGVSARSVGVPKPAAAIFAKAATLLECRADEILHIGDHPELDAHAARDAGYHSIWLNRDDKTWQGPGEQPPTIQSLGELEYWLSAR